MTPEWAKDAIFYQIFPDRFAKSATLAKPSGLENWDTPTTVHGYKGGDLAGVREKLDYLQDLGITALYFCPIFQSASNHRYHTHDYFQVDPLLGGNAAFTQLIEDAHRRGLKVVLDGVFNHSSRGFFQFNDILENGRSSAYLDWFMVNEFPPNAYDHERPAGYAAWWGLHALPKFNVHNPQVREYLMSVAEHWIRLGADGWRLDVAEEIVAPGFWEEFRTRVKAINPEAYIVGEIWPMAPDWLRGDRFDATMNYPLTEAILAFITNGAIERTLVENKGYNPDHPLDARGLSARIGELLQAYPWDVSLVQMNLLDSHDTSRALTMFGGRVEWLKLASILMFGLPGAPCVYYGDEIGLEGGMPDYDARRTFPWDHPERWNTDLRSHYQALIRLRKENPSLRRGGVHLLHAERDALVFGRWYNEDRSIVAVSRADTPLTLTVPLGELSQGVSGWHPIFGGSGGVVRSDGQLLLKIGAREGLILKPQYSG